MSSVEDDNIRHLVYQSEEKIMKDASPHSNYLYRDHENPARYMEIDKKSSAEAYNII